MSWSSVQKLGPITADIKTAGHQVFTHSTHIWTHPGMQGDFCAGMVWLRPYIRLLVEDIRTSEPCWISARFPSFSIRRPCRRVGGSRVWGSWSNLLCHHGITCAILGEPREPLLLMCFLLSS